MHASQDILNSWKEISQYLNRGVRTVQRWERELGLPVRRPRGKGRSAVIAMRSELDHWLSSCPIEERKEYLRAHLGEHFLEDNKMVGGRFLLAATEFGLTMAGLAVCPPFNQRQQAGKTITRAQNAYQIVLKFRHRIQVDEPDRSKLDARIAELRTALRGLGQAV